MELKTSQRAAPVIVREQLESTNSSLKELTLQGAAEGTVLIAHRQSAGRGRMERPFQSPPGGLYLSMLLKPHCSPQETLTLTPCTAVAVCRAVEKLCGQRPDIKWPNDLLLGGKKICGILCESVFFQGEQHLILGVGLNVSTPQEAFGPELLDIAGSLYIHMGAAPDLDSMAGELISELDKMYEEWKLDHRCCLEEYRLSCLSCQRPVKLIRGEESRDAYALSIDEDYALVVQNVDGSKEHISTGEVSLR